MLACWLAMKKLVEENAIDAKFDYLFLDDVDYRVKVTTYIIYASCHGPLVSTCISIAPRASRTPLMSTHASYRLAGEQGRIRGAGGDPGA